MCSNGMCRSQDPSDCIECAALEKVEPALHITQQPQPEVTPCDDPLVEI